MKALKYIILFLIGGNIYYATEILFRGYSHWTMFLLGGICFIFAGIQNEYIDWEYPFWRQVAITELFVLSAEFLTGLVVNIWLGWNIWDYSNLSGNILGQTSWQFALLFLPLCAFAIVLDDWIRWKVFDEDPPHYNFKFT